VAIVEVGRATAVGPLLVLKRTLLMG